MKINEIITGFITGFKGGAPLVGPIAQSPPLLGALPRETVLPDPLPHRPVLPVDVTDQRNPGKIDRTVFEDVGIGVPRDDLTDEHVVEPQLDHLADPAFEIDRALRDDRRGHLGAGRGREAAALELVSELARHGSAEIYCPQYITRRYIDGETLALLDYPV